MSDSAVSDTIESTWQELKQSSQVHRDILDPETIKQMRSDLTSAETLYKYRAFFKEEDGAWEDMVLLMQGKDSAGAKGGGDGGGSAGEGEGSKDGEVGRTAPVTPVGGPGRGRFASVARDGFEQINDDLYARVKNKFVVFNGVGMMDWSSKHRTRLTDSDEYLEEVFKAKQKE
jgi:hypothetical protein